MNENVKPSEILTPLCDNLLNLLEFPNTDIEYASDELASRLRDILDRHDAMLRALASWHATEGPGHKEEFDAVGVAARTFLSTPTPQPAPTSPDTYPQWFGPTEGCRSHIRLDSPTSGVFFSGTRNLSEPAVHGIITNCLTGVCPRTTHAAAAAANKVVARECPVAQPETWEDIDYDGIAFEIVKRAYSTPVSLNDPSGNWRATIARVLRERIEPLKSRLAEVERENDSLKAVRDTYSLEIRTRTAERNEWKRKHDNLKSRLAEVEAERDRLDSALRQLMAIMHGDGGHYVAEHGLSKAFDDAIALFYKMRQELEEVKPTPFIAPGEDISKYPEGVERAWKFRDQDSDHRWFLVGGTVVCWRPRTKLLTATTTLEQLNSGVADNGIPVTIVYDRKGVGR